MLAYLQKVAILAAALHKVAIALTLTISLSLSLSLSLAQTTVSL
jgi:hypothetical protein